MVSSVLCLYTLPPRHEAVRRGFVPAWGEERAYEFWESLHHDLLHENGPGNGWDLVVMTSDGAAKRALEALAPPRARVEIAPVDTVSTGGLGAVFARLAPDYDQVFLAAGDLPGLTPERVEKVFAALTAGAKVAFLRERDNRFSAIGMAPWREELLAFDWRGGKFWEYLGWLEEQRVQVYWEEERLDDLPGPDWVVPVLGYASRRLLPAMQSWPVVTPPQPELVLLGRLPLAGEVKLPLARELASLPAVASTERGMELAAALYRAILFDRMDLHRGRPEYRCVGAFPLRECGRGELIGFPEEIHPLPETGPIESWLRDVLCDLDEEAPRIVCASDVPYLPAELLARAFITLRGNDVVLAPSPDGDYNFVGMAKFCEIFGPGCFESGNALARIRELLRAEHVSLCILAEQLRGLDTMADLQWFRENLELGQAPRFCRLLRRLAREIRA